MVRFRRLSNIQYRLGFIFLAIILLFMITVSFTVLSFEPSKQDMRASNNSLTNSQVLPENQPVIGVGQNRQIFQQTGLIFIEKIKQLLTFQLIFLFVGLVLLASLWWIVRRLVISPLSDLRLSAKRIESGDLDTPITLNGPEETRLLGDVIESLRTEILKSRQELQRWESTFDERLQERTKELEVIATVSSEIISSLSMKEVLKSVTNKALELSNSEVASLCLIDPYGKEFNLRSISGVENAILQSKTPMQKQLDEDCHLQPQVLSNEFKGCSGFCQNIGQKYRSSHLTALLSSDNKIIGELCIGSSKQNAFGPETQTLLAHLASVAAATIENATLYQQAELVGTLEERQRVASEMHDGLLQTLSFLGIMVRRAKDQMNQGDIQMAYSTLHQIERAEEQAEHEIRRAIASLQDNFPVNITLQEQLSFIADEMSKSNPPVHFKTETVRPIMLERQESEQVLRIVREGLLNSQRHSQAEIVQLYLKVVQNEITLIIKDNGIGFEPSIPTHDNRDHFGIKIMQARAERLGGKLAIKSAPAAGTEIELCWTTGSILPSQGKA